LGFCWCCIFESDDGCIVDIVVYDGCEWVLVVVVGIIGEMVDLLVYVMIDYGDVDW